MERAAAGRPAASLPLAAGGRPRRREWVDEGFLAKPPGRDHGDLDCDLRGFTSFCGDGRARRRSWRCCVEYHEALGEARLPLEGTLEHFAGDGLLVFFNDPMPCPDAPARAVRMAVAMRVARPSSNWPRGGVGTATTSVSVWASRRGYATLGRVGFEGRYDYAAIGTVTNMSRCGCPGLGAGRSDPHHAEGCGPGR